MSKRLHVCLSHIAYSIVTTCDGARLHKLDVAGSLSIIYGIQIVTIYSWRPQQFVVTGGLDIPGVKELAIIVSNMPRYIVAKTKFNQFKDMTSIHLLLIQD